MLNEFVGWNNFLYGIIDASAHTIIHQEILYNFTRVIYLGFWFFMEFVNDLIVYYNR